MSSAVSTSTGEVDSSTVRSVARVPVTITWSRVVVDCAAAGKATASARASADRGISGASRRAAGGSGAGVGCGISVFRF